MKKAINLETRTVTFSQDDGTVVGQISYDELSDEMKVQSALHGISQKIGDSYAGAAKAVEELDLTAEEWSVAQVQDGVKRIREGDWNLRAGGGGPAVTDLAVALAEAAGSTVEEATKKLSALEGDEGKEVKAGLRKHPAVAAILARIKAERAAKKQKELDEKAKAAEGISLDF